MFILTNGKNYVMENPMKVGEYLSTSSPVQAKQFSYKQAKGLVQRKGKKFAWIRGYQIVDQQTGQVESSNYKGSAGAYMGNRDIEFDDSILDKIISESNSILGLAGWEKQQLDTYQNLLNVALSKSDSAISDIEHSLQKYKEDNNGKKPQAHKMAKIGYLLDEIRDKHKRIKQCQDYIRVLQDAITYKYDIGKIKLELSKAKHTDYKGRTEYYNLALEILG
jgi:hypothetical protein